MLQLDTPALIAALCGSRLEQSALRRRIDEGEPIFLSTPVLDEWLRGPHKTEELKVQEDLFPGSLAIPFGADEAEIAASIYRKLKRPRGRQGNIAITACAITHKAKLWTLNPEDFRDIPSLELASDNH
jgi:predicted nucleic acid-binding protein